MQPHRCFLTTRPGVLCELPPPLDHPLDLMGPSEESAIRTDPFGFGTIKEGNVIHTIAKDKQTCENFLNVDNLQKVYASLEPAVRVRGLLPPFSLRDRKSRGLYTYYNKIMKSPTILTAYDLVYNCVCVRARARQQRVSTPSWTFSLRNMPLCRPTGKTHAHLLLIHCMTIVLDCHLTLNPFTKGDLMRHLTRILIREDLV